MIVLVYEIPSGRLTSVLSAPEIDISEYENTKQGAVEYAGDDGGLDLSFEWWVKVDDPIPGASSVTRIESPAVVNYFWDWTAHDYLPNKDGAIKLARDRIAVGQNSLKYSSFTWDTNVFLGAQVDQIQIRGFALEALIAQTTTSAFSVDWRLADGSVLTLDAAGMLAVFAAMQAHIRLADGQADALLATVTTAAALTPVRSSIDAINLIDWVAP